MPADGFGLGPRKPDVEINRPESGGRWRRSDLLILVYLLVVLGAWFAWRYTAGLAQQEIPYSEFLKDVEQGRVASAVVSDSYISGTLKAETGPGIKQFITVPIADAELGRYLEQHGVSYVVRHESHWVANVVGWVLPLVLLMALWNWSARRMAAGSGFLNVGNRARIHPATLPKVTFADVAGADEAKEELRECIEFLRDPSRIQRLGGHMPKGLLLLGPPGTGKTLLARAVAGESGVSFFSMSGSEFMELFVGVGAARVRDLFQQAREKAPCIIFIDELDAIGRSRGGPSPMGGHDEREQTLNQLLTEMDGFDSSTGVVVMAATNRPEILDKALLRAGRFDRQIVVDKPDLEAREAILRLHAGKLVLGADVDLRVIAQRTPGFVGADLATIANEAAILAVRSNRDAVTMADFEAAIDRVLAGPEKKHRVLNADEKRRVAFHESGHALVAGTVPTGQPVHKVSIIPRGVAALGYTMQMPVEEKFLATEAELEDQLAILLGGRVAEQVVFGETSSGAANDLERATEIARDMVTRLGMCAELGPRTYGRRQQSLYLGNEYVEDRNYSEATARQIDDAVRALLETSERRAREILDAHRPALDALAEALQAREVIGADEVRAILNAV